MLVDVIVLVGVGDGVSVGAGVDVRVAVAASVSDGTKAAPANGRFIVLPQAVNVRATASSRKFLPTVIARS